MDSIKYPIARTLASFPEHSVIIGDILIGYGEIEAAMLLLVALATGRTSDDAVRILYRLKGAQNRLDVADAILRPFFIHAGMKGPYCQFVGAMRRSKLLRNQYAHCIWYRKNGRLFISDLEAAAHSSEGQVNVKFHPLELELLKEQQAYLFYAERLAYFLLREGRYRMDRRRRHTDTLPKSLPAPSLDSRRR